MWESAWGEWGSTVNDNAILKYYFTVKNDITQWAICLESYTVLES